MGMADYSYQSLANMGPQARWRRVMLLALIPMALAFIYYSYPSSYISSSLKSGSQYALLWNRGSTNLVIDNMRQISSHAKCYT
jgi:hypothetical protein